MVTLYNDSIFEEKEKAKEDGDEPLIRQLDAVGGAPDTAKDGDDKEEIWVPWTEPEEKKEEPKPTFDKDAMIEEIKAEIESGKLDKAKTEEEAKKAADYFAAKGIKVVPGEGQIDSSSGAEPVIKDEEVENNGKIVCLGDASKTEEELAEDLTVDKL